MLHLMKMAAGVREYPQLEASMRSRGNPVAVRTRNMPKRVDEIVPGGSMFWVFRGAVMARQPIVGIEAGSYGDGSKCAVILLEPELFRVVPMPKPAFQGWRYVEPAAAPADVGAAGVAASGIEGLPDAMRRELAMLGLI